MKARVWEADAPNPHFWSVGARTGKKTIRIRRQTRDGFARRTFLGHLVDLRLAKGNERHLRRGEQTADQREKKDEKDVFDKWIHTSIVAHPRLQPHRGTAIE